MRTAKLAEIVQASTPFLPPDARVGIQRIERTKLSLHRGRKIPRRSQTPCLFYWHPAQYSHFQARKLHGTTLPAQRATS